MIYSMQNRRLTIYKITVSIILSYLEKYMFKLQFLVIISGAIFSAEKILPCPQAMEWQKFILNSDCMIILPIEWIKNTGENVAWIFLRTAGQSYLVKIVLIVHNKYSRADIAHNSYNCSHAEQRTRTDKHIGTNR